MGNSKKRLPSKGGNNNSKDDEDDPRESRGNQRSTQRLSERVANGSGSQEKSRAVKSLQKKTKIHKKSSVCEKSITIKRKPKAPAPVKSSFLEEEDDDEDDEEDEDYIPNEQDLNDDLTSEEEDNALDEEEDNALDEDEEKSDNDSDEDFGLNEDVDVSRSTTNAMGSQRSSQNQAGNAFPDSTRIAVLDGGVIQLTLSGGRFTLSGTNQQFQVIGSNNQLQVTGNGNNIRITGSDNSIRTPPGSNHGNIIETNGERNVIMEEPSTLNFPRVLPSRPLNPNFPLIPPPRNPGPLPPFPRPPQTINSTVNGLIGNERFQMPFSEFLAAIQGRQVHNSERVVQARPIPRPRTNCISIGGAGESGSPGQERSSLYTRNILKKKMKLVKGNAHPADGNEDPDSSEEIEEVLIQKPASQRQSPQPSQVESNIQRRDIVNEQNRAYEESLMADQAKQEKKRMEEEEKLMKEQREEHRRQIILKSKEEAKLNLPSEPNSGNSELEPAENVVNLHFRLPSGASVQRNFRVSDTLSVVFQYVYSNPETPERFDLLRRPAQVFILGCLELSLTLQELGFQGKELLVVRDQCAENGDEKKLEHAEIAGSEI